MFPSIQDPGHFPHNRTNTNCHCAPLTVCSELYNSHKTIKTKANTVTVKKQKKNGVSLTFLLWILFELHVYSLHSAVCDTSPLILPLSLPLALAFSPPSLALPFRLKPEGKSLLLNSDAAGLTNPLNGKISSSQWESKRGGGHNHMRRRKRERKALGNDVGGGGKLSSQRETRQRR